MMPDCLALITGGSSGIGAAIADKLAAAGCRLVVLGRDGDRLDAVASRTGARAVVADLCTPEGLTQAADVAADVDLLVNSAGVGWAGDLATMAEPDIDRLVALNLTAPMRLTRAALPGMRARGRGQLVYVSSIAAVGVGGESVYAATKAGLRAFADSVRLEMASEGISVTTVLPGAVRTPFFDHRGLPYDRHFPRQIDAADVASALMEALEHGEGEVFVPRWLSVAARIRGATPELFHRLAQRFG
jgi:short-subunit dehydrogenase